MPFADTHNWKFTGLLGAFLDLAIVYMFLCTSLFVHLALTFLGFLGIPLTSVRSGRFGDANKGKCLQRHLVDCALERLSAVDRSVRSKIPFDLITDEDYNECFELKLRRRNNGDVSNSRINSEDSSRFSPEQPEAEDVLMEDQTIPNSGHSGFGLMVVQGTKGKRFVARRSRNGLRNHRRGRVDFGKLRAISSFDGLPAIGDTFGSWSQSSDDVAKAAHPEVVKKAADENSQQQNLSHESQFVEHQEKYKDIETEASTHEHTKCNSPAGQSFDRNAENAVAVLEQALKEERAARATICVELEKERNAAASAADEAMAMILRLQDEKASIEMEARQFQRMVEEKSTFDAEEMNILKDILLRREREKHFLEKEVEAYRQLLDETDEMESLARDSQDQMPAGSSQSFTEREKMEKSGDKTEDPMENQGLQEKWAMLVQEGKTHSEGTVIDMPCREENTEKYSDMPQSDSEVVYSRVRDVYVVKDKANAGKTRNIGSTKLEESNRRAAGKLESSRGRTVSEMARRLPPLCRPRRTSQNSSGSRRKSMTAVDYERLKIENEVDLLRERLKAVQEGRKELTRQTSLPPLSSRVTSEKRSSRRSSLDIHSS